MAEPRLSRPERRLPRAEPRVLLVDNDDSFTHNVAHAIREAGARCEVVGNDLDLETLRAARPDGVAIGPGPCTPHEAGHTLAILRAALAEPFPPVLGICLGHQALAVALGGRVVRARRPVHGRRVRLVHDGGGCLAEVPSPVEVVRYNSLVVDGDTLPPDLAITARSDEGEIMALRHRTRRLEGVQFHPESWLDGGARALFSAWVRSLAGDATGRP